MQIVKRHLLFGLAAAALTACGAASVQRSNARCEPTVAESGKILRVQRSASSAFWKHWGDAKAELSGYKVTTMRYGQPRSGELVLIYVTEPLSKATLIKDDRAPKDEAVQVLKLNHLLAFDTGIYPYSVMTSVFTAVDDIGEERFSPLKIAFSAQEWCGHVYQQVRPGVGSYVSGVRSYFASEGDRSEVVAAPRDVLYEDALLIQLRELDGPFNGGKDWSGQLVPTLWAARKAHVSLRPVAAQIKRSEATRQGVAVTRFELRAGDMTTTYEVERASPRRVLGWARSDGERVAIAKTARLPYWKLNGNGQEKLRSQLGL